jgi:hypothetical protein
MRNKDHKEESVSTADNAKKVKEIPKRRKKSKEITDNVKLHVTTSLQKDKSGGNNFETIQSSVGNNPADALTLQSPDALDAQDKKIETLQSIGNNQEDALDESGVKLPVAESDKIIKTIQGKEVTEPILSADREVRICFAAQQEDERFW